MLATTSSSRMLSPPSTYLHQIYDDEIYCFAVLGNTNENTIYHDLTRSFPVDPNNGMNYMFVVYVYKLNTIMLRAMKGRNNPSTVKASTPIHDGLEKMGHQPKLCIRHWQWMFKCHPKVLSSQETMVCHYVLFPNGRVHTTEPVIKATKQAGKSLQSQNSKVLYLFCHSLFFGKNWGTLEALKSQER